MAPQRLASLDITRGLIVALMALDHVRIYVSNAQFDPVDLSHTNAAWFFTRLVTHLCAPGFFFIAGFGTAMSEQNGAGKRALAGFLLTRGLWLIVLELTVMGVAWSFGLHGWSWFGVLWGLGASMIALAALIFLPRAVLFIAAVAAMALQEQWLGLASSQNGELWALLGTGGVWAAPVIGPKIVLYPLLPWLCIMTLGYASAPLLLKEGKPRAVMTFVVGALLLAAFLVTRVLGVGGGTPQDDPQQVLAFLNVEKYPPSLQFSLLTLGVLLVFFGAVAAIEARGRPMRAFHPLNTYGRVPFFFYVLHIYLIHGAALLCANVLHWPTDYLFWSGMGPNLRPPDGYGFPLLGVYAAWLVVLLILYPLCAWFAALKANSKAPWLRYL